MIFSGFLKKISCRQTAIGAVFVVSALATPLAFAPYRHYWLMPLLLCALLYIIDKRPRQAARWAFLWATLAYAVQFYWIKIALHDVAGLPLLPAWLAVGLFASYLALYPALAFWLTSKFITDRHVRLLLALPAAWALTEYLRTHALTGFGWGSLGYSQIANSPLAGYAPVGGILLVSWAVMFVACVLFVIFTGRGKIRSIAGVSALAVIVAGGYLKTLPFTEPDGITTRIALIQGNVPQTLKWQPEQVVPTLQGYLNQIATTHADVMILPETAIPVLRESLPEGVLEQFATQARRNGADLAVGIVQAAPRGYANAVLSLTPDAQGMLPFYAKDHLVPFGEYIPMSWLMAPLYRHMDIPLTGFSRGGAAQKPLHLGGQNIAFNICYEDGFGDELIASAKQSGILANVSNLAWYGDSYAMDQHLQQSQARALELGRYMVRATNTGMTAVIDPKGQIEALLPPDTAQVLTADVAGYRGQTPYMRMGGSWLIVLLQLVCLAGCAWYSHRRKARQKR